MKQVEEKSGKQEGLCLATARLLPGRGKGGGKWGGVEGLGAFQLLEYQMVEVGGQI